MDTLNPTPSLAEIAEKYSIPEEFLNPDRYLTEALYLPEELHALLKDRLVVNQDKLLNHEQMQQAIENAVSSNDFTFFGIDHASAVSHELVARSIIDIKDTSFKLAVEYPATMQRYIDAFLQTGEFQPGDDSNKYPLIYDSVQRQGVDELPENLQGTIFDTHLELIQIYPILLAARATNRPVFCFDENQDVDRSDNSEAKMEDKLASRQTENETHVVVIAGEDHCAMKDYINDANAPVESVAQRLKQRGKEVSNFKWDNTASAQRYASPGQVVESVLHAKIKDKQDAGKTQGLRLDEATFPEQPNLASKMGFDYYVAA